MADFYETPSQEIFDDIKAKSITLWHTRYSDEFGYVTEKVDRINEISNFKDNWGAIFGMFDHQNQSILLPLLSDEARAFILERTHNSWGGSYGQI